MMIRGIYNIVWGPRAGIIVINTLMMRETGAATHKGSNMSTSTGNAAPSVEWPRSHVSVLIIVLGLRYYDSRIMNSTLRSSMLLLTVSGGFPEGIPLEWLLRAPEGLLRASSWRAA